MEEVTDWVEWMLHKAMFWETDNGRKGRILRAVHHCMSYGILTLILVSHTIYPALWFQTMIMIAVGLTWIQHMILRGCVFTRVEQRLLGDQSNFWDPYIELMGIKPSTEVNTAVLITVSTVAFAFMGLEWIANMIRLTRDFLKRMYDV
jgi:amino acid transporter